MDVDINIYLKENEKGGVLISKPKNDVNKVGIVLT